MPKAVFQNEPDAESTATVLRELGFDSLVVERSDKSYDERMRTFFSGRDLPFEVHAVLTSDAPDDTFAREVAAHYGRTIEEG